MSKADSGERAKCKSPTASDCTPAVTIATTLSTEMSKTPRSLQNIITGGQSSVGHHSSAVGPNDKTLDAAEHDTATVTTTPSQPLHDKLRELEERWSVSSSRKSGQQEHQDHANTEPAFLTSVPVPVVETPERARRQSPWHRGETSVFDRLYRHGKEKTRHSASRERARASRSVASPQISAGESTISTLSSSESVFDRLYRNDKRQRRDFHGSSRSVASANQQRLSASASLERRLAYTPPMPRRRNHVVGRPFTVSAVPSTSQRHMSSQKKSKQKPKRESVFERLHRGAKRSPTSLLEKRTPSRTRTPGAFRSSATLEQRRSLTTSAKTLKQEAKDTVDLGGDGRNLESLFDECDLVQLRLEEIRRDFFATRIQRTVRSWMQRREEARLVGEESFLYDPSSACVEEHEELAQYLTALKLERSAASTIQSAWRTHLADLAIADAAIQRWSLDYGFYGEGTSRSSFDETKLKLTTISNAIGRVDFQSITQNICPDDRVLRIYWTKDFGVHFVSRKVPKLVTCSLGLQCDAKLSSLVGSWDERKLAILSTKASLEKAYRSERSKLVCLAALKIQAWLRMILSRLAYSQTLRAAKFLQRHFRAYASPLFSIEATKAPLTRAETESEQSPRLSSDECAVAIQKTWRGAVVHSEFLMARYAAIAVQSWERRRVHRHDYCSILHGFTRLQGLYRGRRLREALTRMSLAAIVVQSTWRGSIVRRPYAACRVCAIMIQSLFRRHVAEKSYLCYLRGIRTIQSRFRLHLRTRTRAAVTIQASCRSFLISSRGPLRTERRRRLLIQTNAAYNLVFHVKVWFRRRVAAAITIQRVWRGYQVRKAYMTLRIACIMLQSLARGRSSATRFTTFRKATKVLQMLHRNRLRRRYTSALRIQTAWRGFTARQFQTKRRSSAITIQAKFRSYLALNYSAEDETGDMVSNEDTGTKKLTTDVFTEHMAELELDDSVDISIDMDEMGKKPGYINLCAMVDQNYNDHKAAVGKSFQQRHAAAIKIQSVWRSFDFRRSFVSLRSTAVLLQRWFRAQHKLLLSRQIISRRIKLERHNAASTIQAECRRAMLHEGYSVLRTSAKLIQTAYRAKRARLSLQQEDLAVTLIQRCYRASSTRSYFHQSRRLIIVAQSCARRELAVRSYSRSVQRITQLQSLARGHNSRRAIAAKHLAVRRLCRIWKRHQSRLVLAAAVRIQSTIRGFSARKALARRFVAAVVVQSAIRGCMSRQHFLYSVKSTIVIQRAWRQFSSQEPNLALGFSDIPCKRSYDFDKAVKTPLTDRAARLIQLAYVSWKMDLLLLNLESSTVLLQRSCKGQLPRTATRFSLQYISECVKSQTAETFDRIAQGAKHETTPMGLSATAIAYAWTQAVASARHSSAVVLQCAVRRMLARHKAGHLVSSSSQRNPLFGASVFSRIKLISNVVLRDEPSRSQDFSRQDALRADKARASTVSNRDLAAASIQSGVRSFLCKRRYLALRSSALFVQRITRGYQVRYNILRSHSSASLVQRFWRGMRCRLVFFMQTTAATSIQRVYRMHFRQRRFRLVKSKTIILQSIARELVTRREYRHLRRSAIKVQRFWRKAHQFRTLQRHTESAILIQRLVRVSKSNRSYESRRRASLRIQAAARGFFVRRWRSTVSASIIRLQTLVRRYLASAMYLRVLNASLDVQRTWRGFNTRQVVERERHAALALQSYVRRFQAEALAHQRYKALRILQVASRLWLRRISARQGFEKERNASLILQCHMRRLQAKTLVHRRSMAVRKLQHACRSWLRHRRSIRVHRIERAITSKCERQAKADLSLLLQGGIPSKAQVGICVARLVGDVVRAERATVKRVERGRRNPARVLATCSSSFAPSAADPEATGTATFSPESGSPDQLLSPIAKASDD